MVNFVFKTAQKKVPITVTCIKSQNVVNAINCNRTRSI